MNVVKLGYNSVGDPHHTANYFVSEVAMISKHPMVLFFESVAGDAKKFSTRKKTANVVLKLMKTLQTERDQRGTSNE